MSLPCMLFLNLSWWETVWFHVQLELLVPFFALVLLLLGLRFQLSFDYLHFLFCVSSVRSYFVLKIVNFPNFPCKKRKENRFSLRTYLFWQFSLEPHHHLSSWERVGISRWGSVLSLRNSVHVMQLFFQYTKASSHWPMASSDTQFCSVGNFSVTSISFANTLVLGYCVLTWCWFCAQQLRMWNNFFWMQNLKAL